MAYHRKTKYHRETFVRGRLDQEERALLRGSVADLSSARKFHQERVRIASQLSDQVTQVGKNQYRLSREILRHVLTHRFLGLGDELRRPADRLASAVFHCAEFLAFVRRVQEPNKADAWKDYIEALSTDNQVHLRSKYRVQVPVRANGQVLERFSHLELPQLLIDFEFNTELARMRVNGKDLGSIRIPDRATQAGTELDPQRYRKFAIERLPQLTIRLEGAPIAKMMVASLRRTAEGVAEAPEFTKKMMNGVMHELRRFLGISQKRGAPSLGIGEQAALLLDYEGKNIVQAVKLLCPQRNVAGHQHDRKCQESYAVLFLTSSQMEKARA